jgi:uncharacterized membrane protein YeiH
MVDAIAWFTAAEALGIFSFGVNAAIMAHGKGYSPLGVVLVTASSGMGGSTVRDLLLGPAALPFVWAKSPALLLITLVFSFLYASLAPVRMVISRRDFLIKEAAEALAFASLAAVGAAKATLLLSENVPADVLGGLALPMLAAVIGMIGSTAGLIVRDLLLFQQPSLLKGGSGVLEPALGAAFTVALLLSWGIEQPWAVLAGFMIALAVRAPVIWRRRPSVQGAKP